MSMNNLLTMVNQIGTFFESYPDRAAGALEVATHLQRYWAPSMRIRLLEYIDREQGAGLNPLVLTAVATHRTQLEPAPRSHRLE